MIAETNWTTVEFDDRGNVICSECGSGTIAPSDTTKTTGICGWCRERQANCMAQSMKQETIDLIHELLRTYAIPCGDATCYVCKEHKKEAGAAREDFDRTLGIDHDPNH